MRAPNYPNYAFIFALVIACGGGDTPPTPAVDAGLVDSTVEGSTPDGASPDGGAPDGGDASAFPYPAAKWSRGLAPMDDAEFFEYGVCDKLLVGIAPKGIDFGNGVTSKDMFGLWLDATGNPCATPLYPGQPLQGGFFGRLDGGVWKSGIVLSAITAIPNSVLGAQMFKSAQAFGNGTAGVAACTGGFRAHGGSEAPADFSNTYFVLDSTVDTFDCQFGSMSVPKGGFGIRRQSTSTARSFPSPSGNVAIAIDAVKEQPGKGVVIAGRLGEPGFNFKQASDPDAGVAAGTGFFMVRFEPTNLLTTTVKVFGGTPIEPVSIRAGDHRRANVQIVGNFTPKWYVAPFEGTIDFGTGPLSAGSGQAIGIARFVDDATLAVTNAFAFVKGPASKGKLSRPAIAATSTTLYVADTFWDTVDVGGLKLTASQAGDVFVAAYDLSTGKGLWGRVYGGPGEDYVYSIALSGADVTIVGHSDKSIDFGNGALTASQPDGESWLARFTP